MAVSYKGLVIRFGGDTTELQSALRDVQKTSKETQSDLRDINRSLKFDPGNTELLQQKVKALNGAYDETKRKLDAYKQALSQLETKKQSGERLTAQEERQYDSLKRSIMQCERQLESYGDELKSTQREADASKTALYKVGQAIEDNADKLSSTGSKLSTAGTALSGGIIAAAGALTGFADSQEEAIQQNAQLETAFRNAGGTVEQAGEVYGSFYRILGESDTATEASQNLIRLTQDERELKQWTDIAAGAYAAFGDALPLENLAEAAQETSHTGTVTGGFADALNWATASSEQWSAALSGNSDAQSAFNAAVEDGATKEDAFNEALAACKTEQERASLITQALAGIYGDAGKQFQETNKDLLASRDAQNEMESSMRDLGEAALPVKQAVMEIGTEIIGKLTPALQGASEWFKSLSPEQQELAKNLALGALAFGGVATAAGKAMQAASSIGGAFKTVAGGLSTLKGGADGAAGAFGLLGGGWKGLTGLISANPIGLGIAAVSAAVAGLTWFFTQTETGKQMWADFTGWISEKWQGVQDFFAGVPGYWGGIWDSVTEGATGFAEDLSRNWEGLKTDAAQKWEGVKNLVTSNMESAASIGGSASSVLKSALAGDWKSLASDSRRLFGEVDSAVTSNLQAAKDSGIPIVSGLASGALDKWNWLKTDGVAAFGSLASGIRDKLNSAKEWANEKARGIVDFWQSIPDNIIGFFSGIGTRISNAFGSIRFPSPHVEWGGINIGDMHIPLPTVRWYGSGGYFDQASIIGVGERGGEFVAPEKQLWDFIERAVNNAFGGIGQLSQQIAVSVQVNATVADGMDAYTTGQQIGTGIASKLKQRGVSVAT